MPMRRKGLKYTPELPVVLRNAQPTWREIHGELNARKRREQFALAIWARDLLIKMYLDAEKRRVLTQLDIRIRNFVEGLKARNRRLHRRRLPKPKGGRPFGERSHRLSLAVKIHEAVELRGGKSVASILNEMADRLGLSYDYVSEIHYDPDPEWKLAVKAELAFKYEACAVLRTATTACKDE